ncbi:MAG: DNA repair protein RadC, partial [Anaerolineales bacterium]|nr:DNA repair protein RadC [Anaerolineales bacterium]
TFMGVSYTPPKLKLLALRETPAQRSLTDSSACTNLELLSAVIGGPKQIEIAEAIAAHFKGDLHLLFQASVVELVAIPGVGEATAARIKSALALSCRLSTTNMERTSINSPGDAAALCSDMSTFDVEHLRVIMLNTKSMVLGIADVYKGSVNSSQIRVAEVFRPALQRNAPSIVIAHNHPSGSADQSLDDVAVTKALVQAGKLLNIEVLDHIILGHNQWTSLKEKGLGFS